MVTACLHHSLQSTARRRCSACDAAIPLRRISRRNIAGSAHHGIGIGHDVLMQYAVLSTPAVVISADAGGAGDDMRYLRIRRCWAALAICRRGHCRLKCSLAGENGGVEIGAGRGGSNLPRRIDSLHTVMMALDGSVEASPALARRLVDVVVLAGWRELTIAG